MPSGCLGALTPLRVSRKCPSRASWPATGLGTPAIMALARFATSARAGLSICCCGALLWLLRGASLQRIAGTSWPRWWLVLRARPVLLLCWCTRLAFCACPYRDVLRCSGKRRAVGWCEPADPAATVLGRHLMGTTGLATLTTSTCRAWMAQALTSRPGSMARTRIARLAGGSPPLAACAAVQGLIWGVASCAPPGPRPGVPLLMVSVLLSCAGTGNGAFGPLGQGAGGPLPGLCPRGWPARDGSRIAARSAAATGSLSLRWGP